MFETLDIARLKYIMTMDCDFRCDYCFEGGKTGLNIDPDEAVRIGKQVIDEVPQKQIPILYFGGEPLLRFQDIKVITQALKLYSLKKGKDLRFTIITNGSILSDEIVRHFKAYNYYVSVSCDGIRPAHNTHRGYVGGKRDSYDRVLKSIEVLSKETHDFCVSMVVTNQNCKYLAESMRMFFDMGIRNFTISPVTDNQIYTPDPVEYREQWHKVVLMTADIKERLVINPPLETGWECDNILRKMSKSEDSVNVELSPLGLNIISERAKQTVIDYGTLGQQCNKIPASNEVRKRLVDAENEMSVLYKKLRGCGQ